MLQLGVFYRPFVGANFPTIPPAPPSIRTYPDLRSSPLWHHRAGVGDACSWRGTGWWPAMVSLPFSSRDEHGWKPWLETIMTGWWFEPLRKIWTSIGMIIPNIWENKIHVPNHQPDEVFMMKTCWSYVKHVDSTWLSGWDHEPVSICMLMQMHAKVLGGVTIYQINWAINQEMALQIAWCPILAWWKTQT